jgi:Flp pilus assembly protein CpaB
MAILISIFCALAGAIYFSYDSYKKKEAEVARMSSQVLCAARDVLVGSTLRDDDIVLMQVLPQKVPSGSFVGTRTSAVIGRRTKFGLSYGQIILDKHLTPR